MTLRGPSSLISSYLATQLGPKLRPPWHRKKFFLKFSQAQDTKSLLAAVVIAKVAAADRWDRDFRPLFVEKSIAKIEAILGYDLNREAQLMISCDQGFFHSAFNLQDEMECSVLMGSPASLTLLIDYCMHEIPGVLTYMDEFLVHCPHHLSQQET